MDSASVQFVCFGLMVAALSNAGKSPVWRSLVLMLASASFIVMLAKNLLALLPLAGFLLMGYWGVALVKRGWRGSFILSVCSVLFGYIWLKKYTLLPDQILLPYPYFTLGISYIFFRVLQLLVETRDATSTPPVSVSGYLLYTLNFTTFISGPIQRYRDFSRDQFAKVPIALDARTVGLQLQRIIVGFFKVSVLSMLLHHMHEGALLQLHQSLGFTVKMLAAIRLTVAYPIFLYCNFSGYVDIVIALARLMRIRLPENFDRPFSATSFLDFWNRWHMTLSIWLRTNVYNPLLLALMRRNHRPAMEPFLAVFCFFVTFFLIGVWHGRTSEFVVFGVLQGGGVAANKLWQLWLSRVAGKKKYRIIANNFAYLALGRGLTYSWFAFTLYWFWARWSQLARIRQDLSVVQWLMVWMITVVAATAVLAIWEWVRAVMLSIRIYNVPALNNRYTAVVYTTALGLTALIVTSLIGQAPVIVYKTF